MPRCALPVDQLLLELRKHEPALRAWINRSQANAWLFATDPASALRTANLGIPEQAIAEFEEVLCSLEEKLTAA
jgi:hypothetical protein